MSQVKTCLWFDTLAEDAARFYTSVIPNSAVHHVERYAADVRDRTAGSAMMVEFSLDGVPYQALNAGPEFTFSPAVSIAVTAETDAEADRLWDALTEGGQESQCGWLIDKFGLSWQIVPASFLELMGSTDDDGRRRAMEALMGMRKIDVPALRRAARGEAAG